jgi:small subunit ribosomal protein S13
VSIKKKTEEKGTAKKGTETKTAKKPREVKAVPKTIVRITNKDLDGDREIGRALTGIKGISQRIAGMMAFALEKQKGIPFNSKLSSLDEEGKKALEAIVLEPAKYGIPDWALNSRKNRNTGNNKHLSTGELDFELRNIFKRLGEIKSYRGLRHVWGLPVRGQKTKSTHRGKGITVGVLKKEAKK